MLNFHYQADLLCYHHTNKAHFNYLEKLRNHFRLKCQQSNYHYYKFQVAKECSNFNE